MSATFTLVVRCRCTVRHDSPHDYRRTSQKAPVGAERCRAMLVVPMVPPKGADRSLAQRAAPGVSFEWRST